MWLDSCADMPWSIKMVALKTDTGFGFRLKMILVGVTVSSQRGTFNFFMYYIDHSLVT